MESVAPQQQAGTSKQATDTAQNTPPKVDYATDLFNLLSMDASNENGSKAAGATADDSSWAGFQCMLLSLQKEKRKNMNSMEAQKNAATHFVLEYLKIILITKKKSLCFQSIF